MEFLDHSYPDILTNLAADELLLLEAEMGNRGEILRIWENPNLAVVMGSGGKLAEEIHESQCALAGIPFARRSSGGGTVVLGPGCLCFSLVFKVENRPYLEGITASYEWILNRVTQALQGLVDASLVGSSDLAEGPFKFSGNAQQRKRNHILHHGTLLYRFETEWLERLLPHPPREPDYRSGRSHLDFCKNLQTERRTLVERLQGAFGATHPGEPPDGGQLAQLHKEKYSTQEWLRRR